MRCVIRVREGLFLRGLTELALSVYCRAMTKADVIDSVCGKVGFSKKESAKIVALGLSLRAPDRTLTDAEADALCTAIRDRLKARLGAEIRA